MFNPTSYLKVYNNYPIFNPIFLIGNQGDGLTLLSRMLRRNNDVISVTGNSKYWAGADEMQNVYEPILPKELSGIRLKAPKHKIFSPPRSWSYACDDLISYYRNTKSDANKKFSNQLKHVIGLSIQRNRKGIKKPRFLDKSQVFSVKLQFIQELLYDCNPYFIHLTRNPYVTCYRAASGSAGDMKRYSKFLSIDERIKICIQHWSNTANCIESDKNSIYNYLRIKFEDLLINPKKILLEICDFLKLNFSNEMLPQPNQSLPFGVRFKNEKWYPLRVDVNKQYIDAMPKKYIDMVCESCEKYSSLYGYRKPK